MKHDIYTDVIQPNDIIRSDDTWHIVDCRDDTWVIDIAPNREPRKGATRAFFLVTKMDDTAEPVVFGPKRIIGRTMEAHEIDANQQPIANGLRVLIRQAL